MLGFKRFDYAAITIAGDKLLRQIHKGQFALGRLRLKDQSAPAIWNTVLNVSINPSPGPYSAHRKYLHQSSQAYLP
jgi:hypothetical protein